MQVLERSNTVEYRYGFQGQEKDNEVKGAANSYTTQFRQLDVRLGRWLSLDPKMSAVESPYASMGNSPLPIMRINCENEFLIRNILVNTMVSR